MIKKYLVGEYKIDGSFRVFYRFESGVKAIKCIQDMGKKGIRLELRIIRD